MKAWTVDSLR